MRGEQRKPLLPRRMKYRSQQDRVRGGAGVLIRGTDEFAGLIGTYNETLRVEDIDAGGVMHGHIKLVTRLAKEL